jgi:hypothetical protein
MQQLNSSAAQTNRRHGGYVARSPAHRRLYPQINYACMNALIKTVHAYADVYISTRMHAYLLHLVDNAFVCLLTCVCIVQLDVTITFLLTTD